MSEDKRLNEVIRIQKRRSNFVMMDKGFLENDNLSWKAKGILAYLLSKPDNWKVIVSNIINNATDGKTAVYNGLKELSEHGYYVKRPIRNEQGNRIVQWESIVFEVAEDSKTLDNTGPTLLPDFQEVENKDIDNQDIESQPLVSNDFNKNYCTNNQSSPSVGDRQDGTDSTAQAVEALYRQIKENISYGDLAITQAKNIQLVDEIIRIIVDLFMTKDETVRIDGETKPRALVKNILGQLTYEDIEHVIAQYKGVTERIDKKKQYLLTMLYNTKMENAAHLTNILPPEYK